MRKETLSEITCTVLGIGYLDMEFLADTIEEYKLRVDAIIDGVEENF